MLGSKLISTNKPNAFIEIPTSCSECSYKQKKYKDIDSSFAMSYYQCLLFDKNIGNPCEPCQECGLLVERFWKIPERDIEYET